MGVVRLLVRAGWRRGLARLLAFAIVAALGGGAAMAAEAGGRRTATALKRFDRASRSDDLLVNDNDPAFPLERVASVPGVAAVGRVSGLALTTPGLDGRSDTSSGGNLVGTPDGSYGRDVDRVVMRSGRLADPARADEIIVSTAVGRRLRWQAGQRVRLWAVPPSAAHGFEVDNTKAVAVPMTVTGLYEDPERFSPDDTSGTTDALATPAFTASGLVAVTFQALVVRLAPGASAARFRAAVQALAPAGPEPIHFGSGADTYDRVAGVFRPFATASKLFAALAALATLLVAGSGLARHEADVGAALGDLRSVGVSGFQRFMAGGARGAALGAVSATAAVGIAIAASVLFPIGPARHAEVHPGVSIDGAVLLLGGAMIVAVMAAIGATAAALSARVRSRRVAAGPSRRSVAERLSEASAPIPVVHGARLALARGGARAAIVATVLCTTAVVAVTVFATSLNDMVSHPRGWGWAWDAALVNDYGPVPAADAERAITAAGVASGLTEVHLAQVILGGEPVATLGITRVMGSVGPPVVAGRLPDAPDEIALGSDELRRAGAHIGGTVAIGDGATARSFRVVGRVVLPALGLAEGSRAGLGSGAVLTADGLAAIQPGLPINMLLAVARPGGAAELSTILNRFTDPSGAGFVGVARPSVVRSYRDLRAAPTALAGLLALAAVGTLVHVLAGAVRRRRGDLAILRAVGLLPGQVGWIIVWQSVLTVAAGLVIATPVGIATGRAAWRAFASALGVAAPPQVSGVAVMLVAVASFVVAFLAAAGPAVRAARTRPALVLRAE